MRARNLAPRWLLRLGRRIHRAPWVQAGATELGYRLRRRAIDRRVDEVRRRPRALHIEATNICNASCVFCAYPQMERAKATMPMDRFIRVIDQFVAMGGGHVSLTPIVGDPLVDRLLFERLDQLAARPEIAGFHFFTNAILMTRATSRRLVSYGERLRVCVSIGGFDRESYARLMGVDRFEVVAQNLADYVAVAAEAAARPRLELHVRSGPGTRRGALWDRIRAWERAGHLAIATIDSYDSWAGRISPADLAANGLAPTPRPHMRGPCELLYMKPVVLADGRVNACACRDVEAELIIGDLEHETLQSVFDGEAVAGLRERHRRGDYPDVCRRCTYYVSIYNMAQSRIGANELTWAQLKD